MDSNKLRKLAMYLYGGVNHYENGGGDDGIPEYLKQMLFEPNASGTITSLPPGLQKVEQMPGYMHVTEEDLQRWNFGLPYVKGTRKDWEERLKPMIPPTPENAFGGLFPSHDPGLSLPRLFLFLINGMVDF